MTGGHIGTQFTRHGDAIFSGHHYITNNDIRKEFQSFTPTLHTIHCFHDSVLGSKDAAQEQTEFRIIFHKQHSPFGVHTLFRFLLYILFFRRIRYFTKNIGHLFYNSHTHRSIILQEFHRFIIVFFTFQEVHLKAAPLS